MIRQTHESTDIWFIYIAYVLEQQILDAIFIVDTGLTGTGFQLSVFDQ